MEIGTIERLPNSLWQRLRAQPERAPELIALAASERFAGPAENWVRVAGVGKTPEQLAKIAVKKHVRLARVEGLTLGAGGVFTSAFDLGALLWIQARMVFYVAAAHGYEPRHPMRPAELLTLWGVYDTPAEARQALDGTGKLMAQAMVEKRLQGDDRPLRDKLLRLAGRQLAKRAARRLVPLISGPVASVQNGSATKELGAAALSTTAAKQAIPGRDRTETVHDRPPG